MSRKKYRRVIIFLLCVAISTNSCATAIKQKEHRKAALVASGCLLGLVGGMYLQPDSTDDSEKPGGGGGGFSSLGFIGGIVGCLLGLGADAHISRLEQTDKDTEKGNENKGAIKRAIGKVQNTETNKVIKTQ